MSTDSLQLRGLFLLLVLMFVAGCSSASELAAEQNPAPTQEVVFVVVTATEPPLITVPQSVTDEVTETADANMEASAEATEAPATSTPVPPTAVPKCITQATVSLRKGPGEIYSIMNDLSGGTQMSPQAHVAAGFPDGSWLLVTAGSQRGWVTDNPLLVRCNVANESLLAMRAVPPPTPTTLPTPTSIPPTPTPVPPTAVPISVGRPDGANDPDPGQFPRNRVEWNLEVNSNFLFRFFIRERGRGNRDGAGIDWVLFEIRDEDNGKIVREQRERNAGYCIFGGGEPNCNPWVIEDGEYKWKSNGRKVVDGYYELTVYVKPDSDDLGDDYVTLDDGTDVWVWLLREFWVDVP